MRLKDSTQVNPKELYQYLTQEKGLSHNHAVGMIANIRAESNFNSSAIGDGGNSGGLFQHNTNRFEALKEFSGGNWEDWRKQVDYALTESDTKKYVEQKFDTPEDASYWFTTKWERPSNKEQKTKERQRFAIEYDYDFSIPEMETPQELPTIYQQPADKTYVEPITPAKLNKAIEEVQIIEQDLQDSPELRAIENKKKFISMIDPLYPIDTFDFNEPQPQQQSQPTPFNIELKPLIDRLPILPNLFQTQLNPRFEEGGTFFKDGGKMTPKEFEKKYEEITGKKFEPPKKIRQNQQAREYYKQKYNQQPLVQSQPSETVQQSRGIGTNYKKELDDSLARGQQAVQEQIDETNRQRIEDSRTFFEADSRTTQQRQRDQEAAKQITDPTGWNKVANYLQTPLFQAGNFSDYITGGDDWRQAQQTYNLKQMNPYEQGKWQSFASTAGGNTAQGLMTGMELIDGYTIARALPGFGKNLKNFFPTKTPKQLPESPNAISSVDDIVMYRTQKPGQTEEILELMNLQKKANEIGMQNLSLPERIKLAEFQSRPNVGQAFDTDLTKINYYGNPNIRRTRGYTETPEVLRITVPRKQAELYNVKNFPEYAKQSTKRTEYILPMSIIQKAEKFSFDDLAKLQGGKDMFKNIPFQQGGTFSEDNPRNAMIKARLAYEYQRGNPAVLRMMSGHDSPHQFEDGATGTHYMASMDNYAVPLIQDKDGNLVLGDYGPESKEAIQFDSPEDAEYFAENYKKFAPALKNYEDGGTFEQDPPKNKPLYVTNPNDPRLKAYQDSLSLYEQGQEDAKRYKKNGKHGKS
jgi:hypothetical protein